MNCGRLCSAGAKEFTAMNFCRCRRRRRLSDFPKKSPQLVAAQHCRRRRMYSQRPRLPRRGQPRKEALPCSIWLQAGLHKSEGRPILPQRQSATAMRSNRRAARRHACCRTAAAGCCSLHRSQRSRALGSSSEACDEDVQQLVRSGSLLVVSSWLVPRIRPPKPAAAEDLAQESPAWR